MNLAIIQQDIGVASETFLRSHAEHLPATVTVVHGLPPMVDGVPVLGDTFVDRAGRAARRWLRGERMDWDTLAYVTLFRKRRIDAVLAQYGPKGVDVMEACRRADLPLVVHFHGYEVSERRTVERYSNAYRTLFERADAVVAVSKEMERRLIALGADPARLHYSPCGADCGRFSGASPATAPPHFLFVGRFVEKKSPHLTLFAFAKVLAEVPDARLTMIGDGPLLSVCEDLCRLLHLESAVTLRGVQPASEVQKEMRRARVLVQHSVVAASGDCEGTPVAIIEAGASGLPVVATRHAGIPDVVLDGETGLLVDEGDVDGMARAMVELARNPQRAAALGAAAQARVVREFSLERNIDRLWSVIENAQAHHGRRNRNRVRHPGPAAAQS